MTVTSPSEETLVTSAKSGDRAAFQQLVEIHHDALASFAGLLAINMIVSLSGGAFSPLFAIYFVFFRGAEF